MANKLTFTVIFIVVCLIGVGAFYLSNNQQTNNTQPPVTPTLQLLNSHSHPQQGENWVVSFKTEGKADLTITPEDEDTINDLDFLTLKCNNEERTPQIIENDKIFYPDWQCEGGGIIRTDPYSQYSPKTHLKNHFRKQYSLCLQ